MLGQELDQRELTSFPNSSHFSLLCECHILSTLSPSHYQLINCNKKGINPVYPLIPSCLRDIGYG